MSYSQNDKSLDDGAPIEAYKFITPYGNYLYTSNDVASVIAGEIYEPLPIRRTAININSLIDSKMTTNFILPFDCEIAELYAYLLSPETLRVEVRRVHRGDDWSTEFAIEWIGYGIRTSSSGKWATIETGSLLQEQLNTNVSTVYYQRMCNHVLYDDRCKVNKASFTLNATVTKVQRSIITVDNDGTADFELKGGNIVNTRTGETRGVVTNENNEISTDFPFIDIIVGDAVNLIFGCDHSRLGHCKTRFNNVINYGGMDFIPTVNPFTDLNNEAQVITTVKREVIGRGIRTIDGSIIR